MVSHCRYSVRYRSEVVKERSVDAPERDNCCVVDRGFTTKSLAQIFAREPSHRRADLLGPGRLARGRGESTCLENRHELIGPAGRGHKSAQQRPLRCFASEFFEQLSLRGAQCVFSGHVKRAGRHLPAESVKWRSILTDHADLVELVDGEDRDRAEMRHDVAFEGGVVVFDGSLFDTENVRLQQSLGAHDSERLAHNVALTDSGSMMCGSRPSARAAAALISPRKRGCGRSGRDLNSGCAWVPT